ncbi:pyridoxine 5'-phosphate synthase [Chondromyces apiculatus]|uniref:Pyridoxine 5'-phosphate synthase n=1 Tax=Chondromyces apiculatus DSM 436 TaxID=1192034 RepID=A0A017TIV1_9BACT|nr:pyridoxine 5'-phosphate synthase [Chondromyces apiculatus]EYF08775.1 Pyridoxine 5'-phosphate synthase [Chondromyces apiculatus DSM 436]
MKLSVNVNKLAVVRNSRGGNAPDVLDFARRIVGWGAHGITVHPRADRRHITPADARAVAEQITTVETNFEGDLREEFLDLVLTHRPTQCTLVPVTPGEITSHRGWDVARWGFLLEPVLRKLREIGVRSSLFVEADPAVIPLAAAIGADRVEIYTGPYAHAFDAGDHRAELDRIVATVKAAQAAGVGVNAGHDLTVANLAPLVREAPEILEVSIGHHLTVHALEVGMEQSVKDYLRAVAGAAHGTRGA